MNINQQDDLLQIQKTKRYHGVVSAAGDDCVKGDSSAS